MHACGHDGHTVMLLAAARYLSLQRNFNGTVVFVFQPAEEGLGGAQAMIDDGLLERFPVDAMYALHNWPKLPAGMIGLNEGPMMAAADRFEITVQGQGGHGAHPHQTTDPVLVAAHIVMALQSIVSRNVSPIDAAVLSVTSLLAGDLSAISVIPERATIAGTVRTFRASVQRMMEHRISQVAQGAAQAFGANATLRYEKMMPATTNTPVCARLVARAASKVVGQSQVVTDLDPSMGSEDFSFMLQKVPGAYFRLGQGAPDSSTALHSPHYDFNDAVIQIGAAVFAEIVGLALPLNQ